MTRVTELSVRDFKAVEEAEVQPGGVNLVVGRNNVGKTSLLEALHLALDPSSISRFDGNLDKIVREGAEEATVDVTVDGDDDVDDRLLAIERQDRDHAYSRFISDIIDGIWEIAKEIEERGLGINIKQGELEPEDIKHRVEFVDTRRQTSVVDGTRYISERYSNLVDNKTAEVVRNTMSGSTNKTQSEMSRVVGFVPSWGGRGVTGGKGYQGHNFDTLTTTRFVSDPGITDDTPDPSADGAAIRRSRIEDFLIDNAIVDGLVDFSFDRLVFEDGDKREEIPYDFMGSGFKTLVGILWELYDQDADTEVLIIEEPAVHMHPGYVNEFTQQLLQVARQEEVQLFVTTHREDLIESFFAPPTERAHDDYLREEFQVIQLTELLTKQLDYEQAETELDELNTDLRGI